MPQNYRIYINQNTLNLTETTIDDPVGSQQVDSQNFDFPTFLKSIEKKAPANYFFKAFDLEQALFELKQQVVVVEAAGGLVRNKKGQFLLIFRNGKWDLPKGKIEPGEERDLAAKREVEEECGVAVADVEDALDPTFHVYEMNGQFVLKPTYWYRMLVEEETELVPQLEEGITAVEWVSPSNLPQKLENTFPAIVEVFTKANVL